jgi:hypothetical protein
MAVSDRVKPGRTGATAAIGADVAGQFRLATAVIGADVAGRFRLAALPTPLIRAPRLAGIVGADSLYVKRDDLTGFAFAGNKARPLEFLVAAAALPRRRPSGCSDWRETAWRCCRLGPRPVRGTW